QMYPLEVTNSAEALGFRPVNNSTINIISYFIMDIMRYQL
ncbi:21262_t:CDS:1, partial [Gigaspora rosea]